MFLVQLKILVVCQHYWPEPYPLTDICEELVKKGHKVHVITGVPNYPMGKIYTGYKSQKRRKEEQNGVEISRTFTIARRKNSLFRVLNYYSFVLSSSLYCFFLKNNYDLVFTNQTSPVMMSTAAFVYAKKHSKKVIMYCMDLWPASLTAGGISENSLIFNYFNYVSKNLYTKADKILITSRMFENYLIERHGVDSNKIIYLPQYALLQYENPLNLKLNKFTMDLVFAGNMGAAQSLSTIVKAANILKNDKRLRWHFVGDGSEFEKIKQLVNVYKLSNIYFHGRKAIDEMPQYYKMADAMLITLTSDEFISLTLPGKMQTYMASGKPVIAAANGEIAKVINEAKCGFCAKAEDAQGLADAVQKYIECTDKQQLADNSYNYYKKNFSKEMFFEVLQTEMLKVVD